jgi:hypothetical protein
MRRLLYLEALLNTDQEILGTFSGNLKSRRDDLEWFDLIHIFSRGPIVDPQLRAVGIPYEYYFTPHLLILACEFIIFWHMALNHACFTVLVLNLGPYGLEP